jgi:hypothetical protein
MIVTITYDAIKTTTVIPISRQINQVINPASAQEKNVTQVTVINGGLISFIVKAQRDRCNLREHLQE